MTMDSYMIIKVDHAGKDVNIRCDLCVYVYSVCTVCYLNSAHLCQWNHKVQSRESPEAEYLKMERH